MVFGILFLSFIVDLNISSFLIALSTILGIYFSSKALIKENSPLRIFLYQIGILIFFTIFFKFLNSIILAPKNTAAERDFFIPILVDQLVLLYSFYIFSFVSTILYWRYQFYSAFEAFFCSTVFVCLLSGHRNYQIDVPKELSSLSWKIGFLQRNLIEPHHLIIAVSCVYLIALILYLYFSSNRPLLKEELIIRDYFKDQRVSQIVLPLLLLISLFFYVDFLNKKYSSELNRASEGVGQGTEQGKSNLGFHKAVGDSPQPTALVRLDSDYKNNPWTPMLYFREGALSEFAGNEMVRASSQYDTDIPNIAVGQPFNGKIDTSETDSREILKYSVFLISKHLATPLIDYPTKVSLIKNPSPDKFNLAYQAQSFAPIVKLDKLKNFTIGSTSWDNETSNHYLRAPGSLTNMLPDNFEITNEKPEFDKNNEDLRYLALSKKLTKNSVTKLEKVIAILNYLSQNSIYTKNPQHQLSSPNADPTAPYLFADKMRGYCVHFSHAGVYLFRLAGIPARIGTGYLTDLTYAKDGHILLQMGDRHAWPEIYVEKLGWVIADINPAQAENETAPIPDSKLLEDLMSKINPNIEFIKPEEVSNSEKNDDNKTNLDNVLKNVFNKQIIFSIVILVILSTYAFKLFLFFAYKLFKNPKQKSTYAYISIASRLLEHGLNRHYGETKNEYAKRLNTLKDIQASDIISIEEKTLYSNNTADSSSISNAMNSFEQSYRNKYKFFLSIIKALNPFSLIKLLTYYLKRKF